MQKREAALWEATRVERTAAAVTAAAAAEEAKAVIAAARAQRRFDALREDVLRLIDITVAASEYRSRLGMQIVLFGEIVLTGL